MPKNFIFQAPSEGCDVNHFQLKVTQRRWLLCWMFISRSTSLTTFSCTFIHRKRGISSPNWVQKAWKGLPKIRDGVILCQSNHSGSWNTFDPNRSPRSLQKGPERRNFQTCGKVIRTSRNYRLSTFMMFWRHIMTFCEGQKGFALTGIELGTSRLSIFPMVPMCRWIELKIRHLKSSENNMTYVKSHGDSHGVEYFFTPKLNFSRQRFFWLSKLSKSIFTP